MSTMIYGNKNNIIYLAKGEAVNSKIYLLTIIQQNRQCSLYSIIIIIIIAYAGIVSPAATIAL